MQKVDGIGGIFIVAKDPAMLGQWYEEHLGVLRPPAAEGDPEWHTLAGPTVFAAMEAGGEHFKGTGKTWGINFRVPDLDTMVAQLEAAGIAVQRDPEEYSYGSFASLQDPEGNLVQLWQPKIR